MNIRELQSAIEQIAEEKALPKEKIIETVALALAAAYKKEYGRRGQKIVAELDESSMTSRLYLEKLVLTEDLIKKPEEAKETELEEEFDEEAPEEESATDTTEFDASQKPRRVPATEEEVAHLKEKETRFKPQRHIMLQEAAKLYKDAAIGDRILFPLVFKETFGRIAAQTAKQVIIQQIREAERQMAFAEYHGKENEVVSGLVQRIEGGTIFMDLGRASGILPMQEQLPNESVRLQERLKVYITKVDFGSKGPIIFLSRTHPKMLQRLFELEIPEIASGLVQIKGIAREAGFRSKVAVVSTDKSVDPIGACVGQKGTRISTIINEFNGEKVDIIKWDGSEAQYIANALAPARVLAVDLNETEKKATAWVNEDQQSLAIGKTGQNVRLAAKLTGWKIDIKVKAESLSVEDAVAAAKRDEVKTTALAPAPETAEKETPKKNKTVKKTKAKAKKKTPAKKIKKV